MNYNQIAKEVIDIEIEGLKHLSSLIDQNFQEAIDAILSSQGRVIITGMGKSGIIGKKIAATLASTGTRSFFIHPGEAYHGDLGMIHEKDVVIAISNSGETDEVVKLLGFFKDNKNIVIALTAKENSTLAKNSDHFLSIAVPKEACPLELAPTSSTTATLVMGDAIAVALMKARNFQPENFAKFHPGGSLGRKLLTKVKDVMVADNLPIVAPDDGFEKVLEVITSARLGICLVTKGSTLVGVVTDGDIRRGISSFKGDIINKKAIDLASSKPTMISPEDKLVVAEELMREKKITNLIVGDKDQVEGILQIYML